MKKYSIFLVLFVASMLAAPSVYAGAFIKFDGVDGESQDKDHKNWSDVLSFSQDIHRPGGQTSTTARRRIAAVLEDLVFVKRLDKSSPKLAEAVLVGTYFPKVDIQFTKPSASGRPATYYAYELKNVQVTSYSISGAGQSEEVPTESMSLNFEEIKVTYTETDSDGKEKGKVEYTWKIEEGMK